MGDLEEELVWGREVGWEIMNLVADMLNLNYLWEFKICIPVGSTAEARPYFLNPWYQYFTLFSVLDNKLAEGDLLMFSVVSLRP